MTRDLTLTGIQQPVAAAIHLRATARLIDTVLVAIIAVPLGMATAFTLTWLVGTLIGSLTWFVGGDLTGATAGKRLLGLRICDATSRANPTLGQAVRHEVLVAAGAVPFVGPVIVLVGWIMVVRSARRDEHRRGWHDHFAGTTVTARTAPKERS